MMSFSKIIQKDLLWIIYCCVGVGRDLLTRPVPVISATVVHRRERPKTFAICTSDLHKDSTQDLWPSSQLMSIKHNLHLVAGDVSTYRFNVGADVVVVYAATK